MVGVRLTAVDGVALNTAGSWYVAGCSEQGLTIDRSVGRRTGAEKGSRVSFMMGNRKLSETVVSVVDENSYPVQISCDDFIGAHLFHQALVRVRPGKVFAVDELIRGRFPSLAVVTAQEIEEVIEDLSRDTKRLAWIVAAFWVSAGVCILITLVAASRSQRLREAGILSALGATPRVLARIYTIEFALMGAIAGVIGSVAACGFASLLLGLIFYRWEIAFGWMVVAVAVLCSILLTMLAGWLPTFSLIRQKPMNVLRGI